MTVLMFPFSLETKTLKKKKKKIKKQLQFCYISNGNVDLSNSSNDLLPR